MVIGDGVESSDQHLTSANHIKSKDAYEIL